MAATDAADVDLIAPGARVEVRDEDWLVTKVTRTPFDGAEIRAIGLSELVREQEAVFYTDLDKVKPLRPEETTLVSDDSPGFRRGRLFLEALLRRTPLPVTETRPAIGHRQLLDDLNYQKQAVELALNQPRPRLLIADSVGLGKTLEIGMILSELIRRGRGERILVVTPRAVLEQFQHELWTRFSIPLIRLDSEGIQRVRRKIPASRNPFTYYKRVIVSIDTLKSTGRYSHHLENLRWDAVVIDECHSVTNPSTGRHRLASLLAPRTDALLLASATPHNGKRESFAELINMLDPTAIVDPKDYGHEEIKHLYVRRFKKDVIAEVSSHFPERAEPKPIMVPASEDEEAVIDELDAVWLHPEPGIESPASGKGQRLFPWVLLKAFLSSPGALTKTIDERKKSLTDKVAAGDEDSLREAEALDRLAELSARAQDAGASKLEQLVLELKEIGVKKGSETRVVIFSERIQTLEWLNEELPKRLKLPAKAFRVLHGGLSDTEQMALVEEFGLGSGDVRVLLSGDVASEGVNLHRECHQLIHFDLPWSVIRIDQRNGRIDRYGQTEKPEIRALILSSGNERLQGDLRILKRLLEKEHEIHQTIGETAALMGLHDVDAEEDAIRRRLAEGLPAEQVLPDDPEEGEFDLIAVLAGNKDNPTVEAAPSVTLFQDDADFVEEAMRLVFEDPERDLELRKDQSHGSDLISLRPPRDLQRRLSVLPQSYLKEQEITDRLRLTGNRDLAEISLSEARRNEDSMWPRVGWLGSQHPVIEWLIDKVLAEIPRGRAPVLRGPVDGPLILTQAMYSNAAGQPTVVEWSAVSGLERGEAKVRPLADVLKDTGMGEGMTNDESTDGIEAAQALVGPAARAARDYLNARRDEAEADLNSLLDDARNRADEWEQLTLESARIERDRESARAVRTEIEALTDRLRSTGEPLIRVVGAILPETS
jgi:ERCC4-related helicase